MPYNDAFRGNTSIEFDGEFIAIWNDEIDPIEDIEFGAHSIIHEMFHCFQKEQQFQGYPNDFILYNYPRTYEIINAKFNETQLLIKAFNENDAESFDAFRKTRALRLSNAPQFTVQEIRTEKLEGLAEYVGLKALKSLNLKKYASIIGEYIKRLEMVSALYLDIRRVSYFIGTVLFFVLEQQNYGINMLEDGMFDAHEVSSVVAPMMDHKELKELIVQDQQNKASIIADFIKEADYLDCEASICGYDPMNTFKIDDLMYCKYFIFLCHGDDSSFPINEEVVLRCKKGSLDGIEGYYLKK